MRTALEIGIAASSVEQNLFDELLAKIASAKSEIKLLTQLVDGHRSKAQAKLMPLILQCEKLDTELVLYVAQRLQDAPSLSKSLREKAAYVALQIGQSLLQTGRVNPELAPTLARLQEEVATNTQPGSAQSNRIIKDQEESNYSWSEAKAAHQADRVKRAKSKKSKELAGLIQQEISDSESARRMLYRKLASALHPDREQDELVRLQKTELMAQVNLANDTGDFLALLKLQGEIASFKSETTLLSKAPNYRQYNRLLQEQHKAVQAKHQKLLSDIRDEFNHPFGDITEKSLKTSLRDHVLRLQQQVEIRRFDLQNMRGDRYLKTWVKAYLVEHLVSFETR